MNEILVEKQNLAVILRELQSDFKVQEGRLQKRQLEIANLAYQNKKLNEHNDDARQRLGTPDAIESKSALWDAKEAGIGDLLKEQDANLVSDSQLQVSFHHIFFAEIYTK